MRLWAVVVVSVITFQMKVINGVKSPPPNFVIVLTDDQDVVLNGMVKPAFYFLNIDANTRLHSDTSFCFQIIIY